MRKIAGTALGLYALVAMVAVPYFNWQYAREHGFVAWLLLGEVISTAKGAAWPYFVTTAFVTPEWSAEEKENVRHFLRSLEASRAATRLVNEGSAPSLVPASTVEEILRLMRIALSEARLARDDVLEKAFAGLSGPFRTKYQRSLELQIRALEQGNAADEIAGSKLHDEWVDWLNAHRKQVRIPK